MNKLAILLGILPCITQFASAKIVQRDYEYTSGDETMQGYVAYDDSRKGKLPVVLLVHDWNGIDSYEKKRAEMLAGLGYLAFDIDVYGKGVRPPTPQASGKESGKYYADQNLLMSRLQSGYDTAKALPQADPSKMAAIGYCFGGMCALQMARHSYDLKAVVSFHGALSTPTPAQPGAVKAKLLVLHGADDPFVPPAAVAQFKKEMQHAQVDMKFVAYPGAVHAFTIWDAKGDMKGAKYNEKADKESWQEMRKFFKKTLGR